MADRAFDIRPRVAGPCVADALAAVVCAGLALAEGPDAVGIGTGLVGVAFVVALLVRLRSRGDRIVVDGDRVAWNGTWYVGNAVVVGPMYWLRSGGRAFRVYLIGDDRPRFAVIGEAQVDGFAELYAALRPIASRAVRVFHADYAVARDLAAALGPILVFGAVVGAIQSNVGDTPRDQGQGTLLWAGAGAASVLLLALWAWRARSPLLVIDPVRARVFWRRWIPADQVHLGPLAPPLSLQKAVPVRFVVDAGGRIAITRFAFGDVSAIHQALSALPGVRR